MHPFDTSIMTISYGTVELPCTISSISGANDSAIHAHSLLIRRRTNNRRMTVDCKLTFSLCVMKYAGCSGYVHWSTKICELSLLWVLPLTLILLNVN